MATPFRHFNTFFGDPVRAILTMHLNKAIKEDNLVELAVETGAHLETKLNELAKDLVNKLPAMPNTFSVETTKQYYAEGSRGKYENTEGGHGIIRTVMATGGT